MKAYHLNQRPGFLLMLALSLLLAACSGGQPSSTESADLEAVEDFVPVINATGVVRPTHWVTLSFPSGGLVRELLVERGDQVESGQLLAQLSSIGQARAALTAAQLEFINAGQARDDLLENAELYSAQAQLALANARDRLDDAEYTWTVRQEGNRASANTIDGAEANLILANEEVDRAESFYKHASGDAGRALALSNLVAAKQHRDSIQRNINWYLGAPDEIEQAILDAELAEAQANLAAAERSYEKVKDGPDPEALELVQARFDNAQASLRAAEQALADMELRATFGGTISDVFVRSDEFVGPGQPIMLLADLSELVVETTDLNEIDVARIAVGYPATITFDALPDVILQGSLTYIAPKASEGTGVNYLVEVQLEEAFPESVRWGMTAFVDIQVEP
ncbi:MAG: HlyD family efflux transporter periplasmic adaptor subunit [Anaerolineales bacterium]|nr:MAG: HlyD family efflux transporter periplasmic adaptor subunit [Anaerolineales bacterium]